MYHRTFYLVFFYEQVKELASRFLALQRFLCSPAFTTWWACSYTFPTQWLSPFAHMGTLKKEVSIEMMIFGIDILQFWLKVGFYFVCLFVCNRGDTYYSIKAGSRQGSLAKPQSLLLLTPRPALSSHQHRTSVCLFWSGNLHCAYSPVNPTAARKECFELLDVSNSSDHSFSNT